MARIAPEAPHPCPHYPPPLPSPMTRNESLARLLHEMAHLLELLGENSFKASAHARAARAVESLTDDVATIQPADLRNIDGIGEKIAGKIIEFCQTGTIAEHAELASRVPPGLLDLLELPGLGPKTVRAMWTELAITDRASLQRAVNDGSLLRLPRMGEKGVAKIKAALALGEQASQRLALGLVMPLAESIARHLRSIPGVERVEIAGSLRRGRDTIGDVDLLVQTRDGPRVIESFVSMSQVRAVVARGDAKASCRVAIDLHSGRWKGGGPDQPANEPTIQIDLRVIPPASFGAAWMYFTGSKEHNVLLRQRALARGLTLNEYGLFPEDPAVQTPPQSRGVPPVAAETEEGIYRALGLAWIAPEEREGLRETLRELDGSADAERPPASALVTLDSIRSELHAHTTDSDGRMSLRELIDQALRRGFHTIAVTDHSRSSAIANGLSVERLRAQIRAVREMNDRLRAEGVPITVLAGSEVDILADGRLDYDDELLAELDLVVASPHVALSQDPALATERLLKAVRHPLVHVLGHPTGRLINRRVGLEPDLKAIAQAAAESNTALEINSHWMRLDLRDHHVRIASEAGCLIAINCDDHDPVDFDNLRYGVLTARRGGLTQERCVNAWDAPRLHAWLRSKRPAASASAAPRS